MFIKDPRISVKDAAVRSFSLKNLNLEVTLLVENINPVGITMKTITFDLFYQTGTEWTYLSHGERDRFKIKSGSNEVIIPITINNAALLCALKNMVMKGSINLQIKGTASPDFLLFAPKIPFTQVIAVPLRLPDTSM